MSLALRNLEVKAGRSGGRGSRASKPGRGWFEVSTVAGAPIKVQRARGDGFVTTAGGAKLRHRRGDMIAHYGRNDRGVIRRDIFRSTYEKAPGRGQYRKRGGVAMHARVVTKPRNVRTLEGRAHANRGDVEVRGTRGERWPVSRDKFGGKYRVHF